ncbi:hypothetical protein CERSUDRAFT_118332 [Gelatoporia subvermispora B]|uniref:phosphatidylserine decarboxylase n=1 Tax=Ceriporiopsis subvermispora (strain B) TaxID=914234 RepID=M2R3V7_CERS8|nr:hypothetical protein CERSUDRAFT_118332 [Gelatoporia subvermispora B]
MSTIDQETAASKPVEPVRPEHLPEGSRNPGAVASMLSALVEHSRVEKDVRNSIHAPWHALPHLPRVAALVPGLEKLAAAHHVGNYVALRGSDQRFFESMPLATRLGMHLLFWGGYQEKLLHEKSVESVLKELSVREGHIYDSPDSAKSIPSFVSTYSIATDELAEPDLSKYATFNEFFYRKLKPGARPVADAQDPTGVCSAADCRLTVYPTVDLAKQFWIKGNNFSVPTLLGVAPDSEEARAFEGSSVAIFRLAPADYHRFHSPIDATIGEVKDIDGEYYTVNPQAVNEPGFDVFTANRRSVLYLTHAASGRQVAFVAVGAMLVGSIRWTGGAQLGTRVRRGDELGYFAYGGSTIVALFPRGTITFDADLVKNSAVPIETFVKVGWSIGRTNAQAMVEGQGQP